jgi:MFS family permease
VLTWALNGVGLALMIPNAQSMVADYYSADSRGKAFGMMGLTSATGAMVGALYATNIGAALPGCAAGLAGPPLPWGQ